jgi:hypothetical protein
MTDIYTIIVVGTVLVIGIIPLFFKKFRGEDFLVSYYVDKVKFKEYLTQLKKDGDWIE